jgi:hypothetical protein
MDLSVKNAFDDNTRKFRYLQDNSLSDYQSAKEYQNTINDLQKRRIEIDKNLLNKINEYWRIHPDHLKQYQNENQNTKQPFFKKISSLLSSNRPVTSNLPNIIRYNCKGSLGGRKTRRKRIIKNNKSNKKIMVKSMVKKHGKKTR